MVWLVVSLLGLGLGGGGATLLLLRGGSPRGEPVTAPPPARKSPPPTGEPGGQVVIESDPWAYIHIDGEQSGRTTSARPFALRAGKHRIELVNPELRLRGSLEIEVAAGALVRRFVRLK